MTDGVRRRAAQRSPAAIELRVAARLENLALLRTMVVAVGTFSDLRLAVDEACTALIGSATAEAMLEVVVDPRKDVVVVEAWTTCDARDEVVSEGSISWHVLSSLTDEVQTFRNGHVDGHESGAHVFGITLTTRRAGSSQ